VTAAVASRPRPLARALQLPRTAWLPLLLVITATLAPLISIHTVGWAPGTEVLLSVALVAILFGFLLARSRLTSRWILLIGLVSDLVVAYLVASEAFPGPLDGARNFVLLFGDTVEWVQLRQAGNLVREQPLASAVAESSGLLQDLFFRLETWFQAAFAFQVSRDNVVFLFWMTMAAWGMGFTAAWAVFRLRNAYLAVIPGTLAIGVNITYVGPDWPPFAIFLIASLALTVHTRLASLEARWENTRTDYSEELSPTVLIVSAMLITAVVFLALVLPRAGGNPLAEAFWTYMGDGWGNVEAGIQRVFGGVTNPSGSTLAGRETLALSGPEPFARKETLIIESTVPSYWRGQTFDTYTGQGWRSTMRLLEGRRANEPLTETINLKSRIASRSNIEILESNSAILFAPGDALRLNRPYQVQVDERDAAIDDYASIRATRRVGQRLVYSVDSTLAAATTEQLRTAPTTYPAWADRYIALPELPPRVLEFAGRLAETGDSAIERARAVEFFMRRFPFAQDTEPLPPDRDATDFFLFDLRRGHASQIASTMAVLVRAMDIPARVAVGYTQGVFDPVTQRYIVNPSDSHTWVEVYFPTYGWVLFEPSGFRAPEVRGGAAADAGGRDGPDAGTTDLSIVDDFLDELEDMDLSNFQPLEPTDEASPIQELLSNLGGAILALVVIGGSLVALGVLYLLGSVVRDWLRNPRAAVSQRYERMVRWAGRAGYTDDRGFTPAELGRRLAAELFSTPDSVAPTSLPAPPEVVAETYVRAVYGRRQISRSERRMVDRAWRRIRLRLILRTLRRPLGHLTLSRT
jgi:transglutaminase-like putative cysteine protease